jgi:hypothetical protein
LEEDINVVEIVVQKAVQKEEVVKTAKVVVQDQEIPDQDHQE